MSKNTTHTAPQRPSVLERFDLSFEYDMTWSEAKKSLKERTA